MQKYYIYIGSNNETHKLESEQAISIISGYFEGFTAYEVIGYWKGSQEKTLKVEIISEIGAGDVAIVKMIKELKASLKQDAIMLEKINSNTVFI